MEKIEWLVSWFNVQDKVDAALICVAIGGALIEVGVAIAAVINVHKEMEERRKERLEKYIEIFACVAAFLFLAEAILGVRSSLLGAKASKLLEKQVEELRLKNDALEARMQQRKITPAQHATLVNKLIRGIKGPVAVQANWTDSEAQQFGNDILSVLTDAGFETRTANAQILSLETFGVVMFVNDTTNPPPHAAFIQHVFNESGVMIPGKNASDTKRMDEVFQGSNSNLVLIWVAQKP